MQTVLIPTDFTTTPLLLLKHAIASAQDKMAVIFMYSTFTSDSITDLLFYSLQKILQEAVSHEFREACAIMLNKYPDKITAIRYELFHGNSGQAFRTLVELNKVDRVVIATDQRFRLRGYEFNPLPYILSSNTAVEEVLVHTAPRVAEKDLVAQLLTS